MGLSGPISHYLTETLVHQLNPRTHLKENIVTPPLHHLRACTLRNHLKMNQGCRKTWKKMFPAQG